MFLVPVTKYISHSRVWRFGTVSVRDDGEASATAVFVLLYKAWLPFLLLHHNVTEPHKRGTVNEGREGGREEEEEEEGLEERKDVLGGCVSKTSIHSLKLMTCYNSVTLCTESGRILFCSVRK